MSPKAGESKEQREAEEYMIREISREAGGNVVSKRIPLGGRVHLDVDGFSENPPIICEAWAHIGAPKAAQKSKAIADAFKLVFLERHLGRAYRKVLLFADRQAMNAFLGPTWRAEALRYFEIHTELFELPDDLRQAVIAAQKRQFR